MSLSAVNGAAALSAAAKPSQPLSGTSDYQTFLQMLTVQMQNQDPLNPIESTDYAVQLATFSGVEQQLRTNQLLTNLAEQFALLGMSQMAGWVGQEARSTSPVAFSGSTIEVLPNPQKDADRAVLVVKDPRGTIVSREEIPISNAPYSWFGGDMQGNLLPNDTYSLSVESWRAGAVVRDDPVETYSKIVEVRNGESGTILVLQGGAEVFANSITALRKAD